MFYMLLYFFFSSRRRHTRCALVTGVQTCALPISARLGAAAAPIEARIAQQLDSHFAYMESRLGPSGHFIGDTLSAADIMLSFPAEIAVMQGMAPRYPKLADFVKDRKSTRLNSSH